MIEPQRLITLLEALVPVPGLAGHEDAIARFMAGELARSGAVADLDALGNVIARYGPADGAPRVAVLAHMDTVGFLVKRVGADGILDVLPVGGVNVRALPGAAVRVGALPGAIGVRSQHLAVPGEAPPDADSLTVQVDPQAAAAIEITAPVLYAPGATRLGDDLYSSPYLDNRAGCAVLLALGEWLAASPPPGAVYLIGTVQEETTCLGALSALRAVRPDAALIVDGTLSYDTPETRARGAVRLGGGPVLTAFLYVSGLNGWHAHPGLRAHLKQLAAEMGIAVQQDAVRGLMSDARAATWLGIPSAIVGLPLRAKHAPLEIASLSDLVGALRLLAEALHRPLPALTRG